MYRGSLPHFAQSNCTKCTRTTNHIIKSKRSFATVNREWRNVFEEQLTRSFSSATDWYQLEARSLDQNASQILKKEFKGSLYNALSALFPETEWYPWKFKYQNVPPGFWNDISNQQKWFDALGKQVGVQSLDDWYDKLSVMLFRDNGAFRLLALYNGSPIAALTSVYPEHNWLLWKFKNVPVRFWKSLDNQRKYFDWLGKQLGVKELDDWYHKVSQKVLKENGGGTVCQLYNGSPKDALKAIYPEHNWISWKFNNVPVRYWNSKDNVAEFLAYLSEKLSIQTLDDWYRVDMIQLQSLGGWWLTKKRNLYEILKQQYPHHPWDRRKFYQKGKKTQRWLAVILKKMFPNEEILEDFQHPKALLPSSANRPLQLDVFIPSRSLAFEYQGIQHYSDVGFFSPSRTYQARDEEKRALCAQNNIKLVEVPYWWNRTQEGLQEIMNRNETNTAL